jgi:hypothetical protein
MQLNQMMANPAASTAGSPTSGHSVNTSVSSTTAQAASPLDDFERNQAALLASLKTLEQEQPDSPEVAILKQLLQQEVRLSTFSKASALRVQSVSPSNMPGCV